MHTDKKTHINFASTNPNAIQGEIEHQLSMKGFCVLDMCSGPELLFDAMDDIQALRLEGKLETPPVQIINGLLGEEGSMEMMQLMLPDEKGYDHGKSLQAIDSNMSTVANHCAPFLYSLGLDLNTRCPDQPSVVTVRSPSIVLRGGEPDFERPELTEDVCSHWMGTFNQGKLMLIYFVGPDTGVLELQPLECDETCAVKIESHPDTMVVLRCDMLTHVHCSTSTDWTLCCWITSSDGTTGPRGWSSSSTGSSRSAPVTGELDAWTRERMEVLYRMDMEGTLEDSSVPREWIRAMHHHCHRPTWDQISVQGQAGHSPGLHDHEDFWGIAAQGGDLVLEVPQRRWDHSEYFDPDPDSWMQSQVLQNGVLRTAIRHFSYIDGLNFFDHKLFGMSRSECFDIDPQQRHMLETSYGCLHDAGSQLKELYDARIAVFNGCAHSEWSYVKPSKFEDDLQPHMFNSTDVLTSIISNRVSYVLGLKGQSSSVECEMASAAMALQLGATALAAGKDARAIDDEAEAACCGGVYFCYTPLTWPRLGPFMDPAGRCFSFDNSANGYVAGELCASMCLQRRLETVDGVVDVGDSSLSYGTVVGWKTTNNGRTASLTAPNGPVEQETTHGAVRNAGIHGLDVDGMECHADGSLLGDGVEVTSMSTVLRSKEGSDTETLLLGAPKTHVGAQREACAMTQVAKILFNITYGVAACSLHLCRINSYMDVKSTAVVMNSESLAYRDRSAFHGVASRGLGGTNVNLILWHTADERRIPVEKPELAIQDFNFWPGGGGILDLASKPSDGYFIVGSWNSTGPMPEEMEEADDAYHFTITLGVNRFETFQIWLDGRNDKVLHPGFPQAPAGSAVCYPADISQAEGFKWKIPTRDEGKPGDRYKVQLLVAGKYRAVTWNKVETPEESRATAAELAGSYYIMGSFNGWTLKEMIPSTETLGLYTIEVGPFPTGVTEFQVIRNQDLDQAFFPAAVGNSGDEVLGPSESVYGRTWYLSGSSKDIFTIEFQRKFEDNKDLKSLTWSSRRKDTEILPKQESLIVQDVDEQSAPIATGIPEEV